MSSQKDTGKQGSTFSESDIKFFTTFFKYLPKNVPEMDWEGIAKEIGLKDGGIAKCRFRQIRKKHGLTDPPTPGKAPSKVVKNKNGVRKLNFVKDDEDEKDTKVKADLEAKLEQEDGEI
ncbi:hypothetical protein F5Y15DRAFT_99351 [Xylariaceae sp. FL0016]|nr:hypothetical protein F5Y15DRAFT_99351 [Xylariaceae sp. FL0016]